MIRTIFIILFIALLTSACSKEDKHQSNYEGRGESWDVSVENSIFEKNDGQYFNITYSYKGPNDELRKISHLTFAQGTLLNTQIVNVFDYSHKEKLIAEGKYQEEEVNRFGTIFADLKNKKENYFKIEYRFNVTDKDSDFFKAIDSDRLNVQIEWENNHGKHHETIEIKGNDTQ
ncbi:hypothetical protein [Paenibacillus eucommiae]|uniref:Uncharacterized protein n=1 Tax=Paenibacillus eucommiae TaxID=1355755 RepID=A0ABS4IVD6_9BACL|nr:hypothetical protein [Paenibacillus eucommiae]MBP1991553.1 hypothetical protein [Paenibacillus eucommiae]